MPYKDSRNPKLLAYKKAYYLRTKEILRVARKKATIKWRKANRLKINKYLREKYNPEIAKVHNEKHKQKLLATFKEQAKKLDTVYLIRQLKKAGWTIEQLKEHPEIIDIYKLQLKTKRLCKLQTSKRLETV